jgi:putative DNA methylase
MTDFKRKLIEVALPLDAINVASAREKSIRHGHPSTLHLWWARRPLAACRAVLFAQLVDDPSSLPEEFPTEELQDAERERLFRIIEDLVKWENTTNEEVLEAARAEIRRSCGGDPPPILDPFAGGGSIPLEAQRLGLEAHASDLNPVAVLINKAMIEIPPRWAGHPPVHPDAENRTHWKGAEGLAEDVRCYGKWMRDEAERRIGHLYPRAILEDGSEANVVAWIWARTITCPNPACGATIPMISSPWLGKKKGKEAWLLPIVEDKAVRFRVSRSAVGPAWSGNAGDKGVRCFVCNEAHALADIRPLAKSDGLGELMVAVVAEGNRKRTYLEPTDEQRELGLDVKSVQLSEAPIPDRALGFRVAAYGLNSYDTLFTSRQSALHSQLFGLVGEAAIDCLTTAKARGFGEDEASTYAVALKTYLALGVSRFSGRSSNLCIWLNQPKNEGIANVFTRPTLSMNWDFAEVNPFSQSSGNLEDNYNWLGKVLDRLGSLPLPGTAVQADARSPVTGGWAISTDPPYYDNVGYADLSDFFYVPLRMMLQTEYPELFPTIQTPKSAELISDPSRHESVEQANDFFETGFVDVFREALAAAPSGIPMTVFYAFKQNEKSEGSIVSTGWATILEALMSAGWTITATWPVRTERPGRMRDNGSNALASSVVLACRPRPDVADVVDRQLYMRALRDELRGPLRDLQKASIAPVDLRQAAIGPGMAVFSRYAKVLGPDGEPMPVRTALGLINQVLGEVLDEQEVDFDSETRWAIQWFSQFFESEGPYGVAEQLAVSMNVSIEGMVKSGILGSGGGKVRLLGRDDLPDGWDPTVDLRKPVWEATQHLVKRLESEGESSAGRLLRQLGGMGESCRELAYRLYTICETTQPKMAGPYNALAASWPQLQQIARTDTYTEPTPVVEQQTLDT